MNLKLSFSWVGLVIFALPMVINIFYVIFPPANKSEKQEKSAKWIEIIEQVSRILYLLAVTFLVSENALDVCSFWLYLAAFFLILYYAVWVRYFAGGRRTELLNRAFLFVPMPLAIFPVLYFLCAAVWMSNIPAVVIMMVFGASHLDVSIKSFK